MANNRPEGSRRSIGETMRLYEGLLARPLDERQLIRPNFSCIQAIVKSLITETKIMRNIFNPIDFDTEKRRWDKRMRVEFVQKLIDFVANQSQPVVGCVAAKVVAGLEPNKTHELLQSLARIAHSKLSPGPGQQAGHLESQHKHQPLRPRTFTKQLIADKPQRSTSGTRAGGGSNQIKRPDQEPRVARGNEKAALSSMQQLSSRRASSISSTGSGSPIKMSGGNQAAQIEQPPAPPPPRLSQSPPKATPPLSASRQPVPALTVVNSDVIKPPIKALVSSESDINNKNLQHLRVKLKQLRTTTLNELSQMEESLETNLGKLLASESQVDSTKERKREGIIIGDQVRKKSIDSR